MKELQIIYDACCRVTGYDIGIQSRKRHLVYARFCYFHFSRELTTYPLESIGLFCGNRDHATVLHGLKQFKILKHLDDFKPILMKIEKNIPDLEKSEATREQRELKMLYSNKSRLEKQVELLTKRLANTEVEREILDMFKQLPTEKLFELKEYRIKPFLKMNAL